MRKTLFRLLVALVIFAGVSFGATAASSATVDADAQGDEMSVGSIETNNLVGPIQEAEDEEEFEDRLEHLLEN